MVILTVRKSCVGNTVHRYRQKFHSLLFNPFYPDIDGAAKSRYGHPKTALTPCLQKVEGFLTLAPTVTCSTNYCNIRIDKIPINIQIVTRRLPDSAFHQPERIQWNLNQRPLIISTAPPKAGGFLV